MPEFSLPYGHTHLAVRLPEHWQVDLLAPKEALSNGNPQELVRRALKQPYGPARWHDLATSGRLAIVVNDPTRATPVRVLLPPVLEELQQLGITYDQIRILIAAGLHKPPTEAAVRELLGEIYDHGPEVIIHEASRPEQMVYLGETSRGTPVRLNRHYLEAEKRLVLGAIEPHQLVGFSGGAKSVAIGLAGEETIKANHFLSYRRGRAGWDWPNAAREDIEEIGAMARIDFIINAILGAHHQVAAIVAGHFLHAFMAGIAGAREIYEVKPRFKADVVIVSPGGYPRDIDLYQSQKALARACTVVKKGGVVVLAAQCCNGVGESEFVTAVKNGLRRPREALSRADFSMGKFIASRWLQWLEWAGKIVLVSDGIPPPLAAKLGVVGTTSMEEALDYVRRLLPGEGVTASIMPVASSLLLR